MPGSGLRRVAVAVEGGGVERIFVEGVEHSREITLAGIGQQRHDALAAVFGALGQ